MKTRLEDLVNCLRESEGMHHGVWMRMTGADNGAVYPVDLLANAVINRSINLLRGYCDLVEKRNFICAAALLRLQLDNCLRFSAVFLVSSCHDFATEVL